MKFTVSRDTLLQPLTIVAGAVERRQTMPILSNICLKLKGSRLFATGTDLEVELSAEITVDGEDDGEITVPARKFVDICKSLPGGSDIRFSVDGAKVVLQSNKSRFSLVSLPASDFPSVQREKKSFSVTVNQKAFADLIQRTAFSMAQQDVRYYLNGMLWELSQDNLRAVATDGHRLAVADVPVLGGTGGQVETGQVIVPRKGVLELSRLLSDDDGAEIEIEFGANHISASTDNLVFVSKLVDGKFPDYQRVLPKGSDKLVVADRLLLKAALSRAAILSNEKFRGVRFLLEKSLLGIQANNPEQEEASEEVMVDYDGESLEMGFNVSYLIEVLGALKADSVSISLADANSSALIQDGDANNNAMYVVMPMRL